VQSSFHAQEAFLSRRTGKVSEKRVFLIHTKALLKKRFIYGMRDKKSFCFQLVIPTMLVFLGMILLTVRSHADQPSIQLLYTGSEFNPSLSEDNRNPLPVLMDGDFDASVAGSKLLVTLQQSPTISNAYDVTSEVVGSTDQFSGCALGAAPLVSLSNYLMDESSMDEVEVGGGVEKNGASTYAALTISNTYAGERAKRASCPNTRRGNRKAFFN